MLRLAATILVFLGLSLTAQAQDRANAILVLDGSGSMWGQIDGVNKIVIARDVVGDLLSTLPDDQALGLMAYGHRAKGDCGDIELLAEPGASRADLATAVQGISPMGKTPLSAAVIQAAETLKYSEEVATVILVSDGIETCDFDPCEVGRRLEATGVNFTAHVIGFDVADPAARAQLQCLADETGGTFRTADDADELADALTEMAAAPAPEPMPEPEIIEVRFNATDGDGGPVINEGLIWTINAGDAPLATGLEEPAPSFNIEENTEGTASVLRLLDEASVEVPFTVTTGTNSVTVALPEYKPLATLTAPASAPAGSLIDLTFTGPRGGGDYISSSREGSKPGYYDEYTNVSKAEGDTLSLRLPPVTGPAEIRYVLGDGRKVLATTTVDVTPLTVSLSTPENASVGTAEQIEWTGPDYGGDYITVSKPDEDGYETYAYTKNGSPLSLKMPTEEGTYEIRYVLSASREVAARSATFEVGPAQVTVDGPAEAAAGSDITVTWTGPDAGGDYIAISRMDDENGYETYTYTKSGSPLTIETPIEPGAYEIRYFLAQGRNILATAPLTLTAVGASVSGPATAVQGSEVEVTWDGPDYDNDYIGIGKVGEPRYVTYTYTKEGSPLKIEVPGAPGDYEYRYIPNADQSDILATAPLTVEAASVSFDAPDTVEVGAPFKVGYTGPNTHRDWIDIARGPDDYGDYEDYDYTQDGGSGGEADLKAPTEPGTYLLRYVLNGRPSSVIATQQITVVDVAANVAGMVGADGLSVTFDGPGHHRDLITVAEVGSAPGDYVDYAYARNGSPIVLDVPETPGTYELRYVLEGNAYRVLATAPITVD